MRNSTKGIAGSGRGIKLAGWVVLALVWNGVVAETMRQMISQWQSDNSDWLPVVLVAPFVLVGIGIVARTVRLAMLLSNPQPHIAVRPPVVTLGDEIEVTWSIEGRVEKLRRFTIDLEGREEAAHFVGRRRRTYTDRAVFAAIGVVDQVSPSVDAGGSARVTVPSASMHSFDAPHNKIVWVLKVRAEIPNWSDLQAEHPLSVTPLP